MVDRAGYIGATRSVANSTANNSFGEWVSTPPASVITVEVVASTGGGIPGGVSGTFRIDGSLTRRQAVIASTGTSVAFSTAARIYTVASSAAYTNLRAVLLTSNSTLPVDIFLAAR